MKKQISTTMGILIIVLVTGITVASLLFLSKGEEKEHISQKKETEKEEKILFFEVRGDIDEKLRELYGGELEEELLEDIYFEMIQAEKDYGIDFSETSFIEIEYFGNYFRIIFLKDDIAIYGIDIDKKMMEIIDSGILG